MISILNAIEVKCCLETNLTVERGESTEKGGKRMQLGLYLDAVSVSIVSGKYQPKTLSFLYYVTRIPHSEIVPQDLLTPRYVLLKHRARYSSEPLPTISNALRLFSIK